MRLSHIGWNLGGLALPLGVAALTVPHLIEHLGHERFGLLALAWGLIGYAGALDLGIGRALTQRVAQLRGEAKLSAIPDVLATARHITLLTGLIGGVLIGSAGLVGGTRWIHVESTPPAELRLAVLLLAMALPAQAMSATYRGLNEAFLNFSGISLVRAGLGIVNFAGPYWISLFTVKLHWLVATLAASRLFALFVYQHLAIRCLRMDSRTKTKGVYSASVARSLFSFSGWVTVSSVVSPILVQADRFMIASLISAATVSIYVVPYEMVVQSLILVGAVSSVMFPDLSRLMRENDRQWWPHFKSWTLRVAGTMAISCAALALLLPILLKTWIGKKLQSESIMVGQILCLGVFFNALGSMYYTAIHAKGRADVTAKIHLTELPLYIAVLFFLITNYGVIGAAVAWVGRVFFDTLVLSWYVSRNARPNRA